MAPSSIKLDAASLGNLGPAILVPTYDRNAITPCIVHFVLGNFHRVHQAVYVDRCLSSPGAEGWTLDAAKIRATRLTGAPVVVLADCAGGAAARYEHEAWGLPLAFRTAGARAVIASLSAIPDRDAAAFFDALVAEFARGTGPAPAVARVRAETLQGDPTSWMRNVVVFQ